jgi:tetratricopeptide (TPR) repeat protein
MTCNRVGRFFFEAGNYKEAEGPLKSALHMLKSVSSKDNESLLCEPLDMLGKLSTQLQNFDEAVQYLSQSLEIGRRAFGAHSLRVANTEVCYILIAMVVPMHFHVLWWGRHCDLITGLIVYLLSLPPHYILLARSRHSLQESKQPPRGTSVTG